MGRLLPIVASALVLCLLLGTGTQAAEASTQRTEAVELQVGDTRFVVDAARGMEGFVREVSQVVQASWPGVVDALDAPADERIFVHVERRLQDWFERESLPWVPPEWAAGLAIGSRRTMLIAPGNPEWASTTVHELVHLAVALAAGDQQVPKWFNEGIAVMLAEQWDLDRASLLLQAGVFGNFLTREELDTGWPRLSSKASLAYAQSFAIVRFGKQRHGDDVYQRILATMRSEQIPWPEAFVRVTGESQALFWDAWLEQATTRWRFVPLMTGAGLGWTMIAGLAFVALRRRKRLARERLERMAAREAQEPVDPDDEIFG